VIGLRCGKLIPLADSKNEHVLEINFINFTNFYRDQNRLPSMDGWFKSGRDKISARGPQIGPNVHHTDEKLNNLNFKRDK
jgi:hypothetical protein